MRNPTVLWALTLSSVAVLLASPAAASPANLAFTSGIPLKVHGTVTGQLPATQLVATDVAGALGFTFTFDSADLLTLRTTTAYQTLPTGGRVLVETRSSESLESLGRGTANLAARSEGFFLHASATDAVWHSYQAKPSATGVWSKANAQVNVLLRDRPLLPLGVPVAEVVDGADSGPVTPLVRAGSFEAKAETATAQLGLTRMAWHASVVRLQADGAPSADRASATTTTTVSGGVYVPGLTPETPGAWTGPGSHVEQTIVHHEITTRGSRATVAATGADFALYAQTGKFALDGYAGLPWAQGTVTLSGETRQLGGNQAIVGGTLNLQVLQARLEPSAALELVGSGDVTFLQIGPSAETFPLDAVVATGTGAALVAAGATASAYYWPLLKWGATSLLWPLYARLPKDRILDHRGRELVYERIRTEPGISTNRLARDAPFGWSTLAYHLRVLERNEKVISVRDGRYKRFFDRESGLYANGRKFVVAVLKNETTFAIGRLIRAHPGITQKGVSERFGLAPSSVHWHVERLEEAKLLEKTRDGHHVRYAPGPGWNEVRPEDLGLHAGFDSLPLPAAAPALTPPSSVLSAWGGPTRSELAQ